MNGERVTVSDYSLRYKFKGCNEHSQFTTMSPLQDFLQGSKAISILEVSIIKDLGSNMFIISDEKDTCALLFIEDLTNTEKLLKTGKGIKIIKPEQIKKNILKPSPRFRIQPGKHMSIKIGDKDLKNMETLASTFHVPSTFTSFGDIEEMSKKGPFISCPLDVLVTKLSRPIKTNYGPYRIAGIKDHLGNTSDINFYGASGDTVEPFKIYTITKAKVTTLSGDNNFHRLATTRFSVITKASSSVCEAFKDVCIGEVSISGKIAGVGDVTVYTSCTQHKKKVSNTGECPICQTITPKTNPDYYANIYIQDENNDIQTVKTFNSHMPAHIVTSPNIEDALTAFVTDKHVKADVNIFGDDFICVRIQIF